MKKNNKNTPPAKTQPKKQIEQTVRNLVEAKILSLGYELWNVEYYNDGSEWLLDITIDNPSGISISIDDCEKVTHAVNPLIDEADPIENAYSLAVSSPGLNRELKNDFHLNKYINNEVTVKLFAKNEITGSKSFNAIFKEFSENVFKFEITPEKTIILTKKEIAHIYAHDYN